MIFPDKTPATLEMAKAVGLSDVEFKGVVDRLGRTPNFAELGIFSAMFSEHCSYKSSKKYLRRFPTTGKRVLQGPGENAGIVDIGDGWAVAFKMESHNHPSFIEPYQGAATGVGGILRDIFTMGARPVGSMNGLCFGMPTFPKTDSVVRGVVKGIGDYGNCVGVPMVAGQTFFHPCYDKNPLVNAFTVGLVKRDQIYKGLASGVGNIVVYVGSKTGRDGVHGATMASREFSSEKELERPTVQVGDPFTEKLLLEATLEAMRAGLVVGIQDMGAAGITSSCFEMAGRAKTGLEIQLDRVPMRESGMTAYELLLSESQERMVLVAEEKSLAGLKVIFEKWDLHAESIGRVVEGNRVKMTMNGEPVVDLPIAMVIDPPMADRPLAEPSDLRQRWFIDRNRMYSTSLDSKFQALVADLNFADPSALVQQYDSTVGNRSEGGTYDDAAVLRLRDIEKKSVRLAMTIDCNPRVCWLSPLEGGRRAIAESAINLATRGAEPIGVTDCLNFGSPENPEVMWQFQQAVEGISQACESLKVPVISGNVSFYNDTDGKPIYPTPMIGMVGIMTDALPLPQSNLFSTELEIALVGPLEAGLGGSVLAGQWFKRDCGKPDDTDLTLVDRAIKFCHRLRQKRFTFSLHDISDGGLVTAVLEMALRSPHDCIGVDITVPSGADTDCFLFGESIPRILVAYDPSERVEVESVASQAGVGFHVIGQSTDQERFRIIQGRAAALDVSFPDLKSQWRQKWSRFFN